MVKFSEKYLIFKNFLWDFPRILGNAPTSLFWTVSIRGLKMLKICFCFLSFLKIKTVDQKLKWDSHLPENLFSFTLIKAL